MSEASKEKPNIAPKPRYVGRIKIVVDEKEITRDNLLDVLLKVLPVHWFNAQQIQYLYRYYRGDQPIYHRVKSVRPEINNIIVENRANEIVSFKTGYLMGEPVQYVARTDRKDKAKAIGRLNELVFAEDKAAKDKVLADWMHIAGQGYRIVLPDRAPDVDEAPFEIFAGDPRVTFVVYSSMLGQPPLMGGSMRLTREGNWLISIYTPTRYFEVLDDVITKDEPHMLGMIPIIEYPANEARLGAFEIVLPLLDAINNVDSNRLDDIEQIVQALLLFHNVDIDSEDYKKLREEGAIKYRDADPTMPAEIKYIVAMLSQSETQTLADHLYETVLTICGMPNRNGGTSTSDTGAAVIMRDGWSAAEARARDTELMFKQSEKEFLKLLLRICRNSTAEDLGLSLADIEVRFTRRNYENIQQKAQVLTTMLDNDKIAPLLAFTHSGMFSDPQVAYQMSVEYQKEQQKNGEAGNAGEGPAEDDPADGEDPSEGAQRGSETP